MVKVNCVVLPEGDLWVTCYTCMYSFMDDLDFGKLVWAGLLGSAFVDVSGGVSTLDDP